MPVQRNARKMLYNWENEWTFAWHCRIKTRFCDNINLNSSLTWYRFSTDCPNGSKLIFQLVLLLIAFVCKRYPGGYALSFPKRIKFLEKNRREKNSRTFFNQNFTCFKLGTKNLSYLLVSCNNFVRFITKKMAFIHDSDISGNPAFMLFNPYQRFPCPNFASTWVSLCCFLPFTVSLLFGLFWLLCWAT